MDDIDFKEEYIDRNIEALDANRVSLIEKNVFITALGIAGTLILGGAAFMIGKLITEIAVTLALFDAVIPVATIMTDIDRNSQIKQIKKEMKHLKTLKKQGIKSTKELDRKRLEKINEYEEQQEACGSRPKVNYEYAESLCSEKSEAVSVEQAVAYTEHAGHERSNDTAYAVNRTCADGIVYMEFLIYEFDCKHKHCAACKTYYHSSERGHEVATGCYADKSGKYAVKRKRQRRFAILEPADSHSCNTAGSGCEVCGKEHVAYGNAVSLTRSRQLRTGIKSEPSEPQYKYTKSSKTQAMTGYGTALSVFAVFAKARTENQSPHKSKHTAYGVNNGTSRKVVKGYAERVNHETACFTVAKPSAAPCPVSFDGIDNHADEYGINQIHIKLGTFSHCAGNYRGGSGAKHGLEHQKSLGGKTGRVFEKRKIAKIRNTHESFAITTEHNAKTNEPEKQRAHHEINEVLEQNIRSVFAARETRLTQGKTGLHEKHKHCRKQHPYSIYRQS